MRTLLQLDEPTPHARGAQVSAVVAGAVYVMGRWARPVADNPLEAVPGDPTRGQPTG